MTANKAISEDGLMMKLIVRRMRMRIKRAIMNQMKVRIKIKKRVMNKKAPMMNWMI